MGSMKMFMVMIMVMAMVGLSTAKLHHLFVGNLGLPASIHALEFDDEMLVLRKTKTIKADGSSPWITLSHDKRNLYASQFSKPAIASYSVLSPNSLRFDVSINSSGLCFNGTSAYVQALGRKPWTVFTGEWPGPGACGQSLSTHSNGTLKEVQQTWGYGEKSGIHGLGINERGNGGVLYSADVNGDAVWTHSITYPMAEGEVEVKEIGKWTTRDGTHPRHLVAHKNGETVHVVGESGNVVLELEVDGRRVPRKENGRWRTVPDGLPNANYWSAEVKYSENGRYLWATARAQANRTDLTGWINIWELDTSGHILSLVAREPTTTKGGIANAIAPMDVDNDDGSVDGREGSKVEYAALTDVPTRYVEVWRLDAEVGKLEVVAHLGINDGGCCANVVWLD